MTRLLEELRRRNVFRVAAAYLVVGWLVMQVVATIGGAAGLPEWADSLALIILVAGFPVVAFVAWAFELTPEGVKKTEAASETGDFKPLGPSDFVLIAAVLVVLGIAGIQVMAGYGSRSGSGPDLAVRQPEQVGQTEQMPPDSSIAVLPFADLSPGGDQQYFSDGIAEEILNVLARIDGLNVASRTSAFQYRGEDYSIPEIAEGLGVRHILEGSVRRDGDTVRITAQLIDARDDRHLWSQTYDRPLTAGAIFSVQDDISSAIVAALRQFLDVETGPQIIAVEAVTDDIDAYGLYLEARSFFQARDRLDEADALLERALSIDPDFSQAWEMRAALPSLMVEYFFSDMSRDAVTRLTGLYAARALALNPDSALAIATLAKRRMNNSAQLIQPDDWSEILSEFDRARAIDPRNASVALWQGLALAYVGDIDGSIESFQRCIDIEPAYRPCHENYIDMLVSAGRDDDAVDAFHSALERGAVATQYVNLGLLARLGLRSEFMLVAGAPERLLGWDGIGELYDAYLNVDADHSVLIRRLRDFVERNPDRNPDGILEPLYTFAPGPDPLFSVQILLPNLARYRQSEHYEHFVRETGILDYWRTNGFPAFCQPEGPSGVVCE